MAKSRQDLKREYKERVKTAGVYQIRNTVNGRILLGGSLNIDGPLNMHKYMLSSGMHKNQELQKDWSEYGPDKFIFEVLETVKIKDEPGFDIEAELSLLEEVWFEKLKPLTPRGYNLTARIRYP